MPRMANVLLLREPSVDDPDRYHEIFHNAGYNSVSVPVLETSFTNLNALSHIIQEGPIIKGLKGVVVTSKRSCEAWGEALRLLHNEVQLSGGGHVLESKNSGVGRCVKLASTSCIQLYFVFSCVGPRAFLCRRRKDGLLPSGSPHLS